MKRDVSDAKVSEKLLLCTINSVSRTRACQVHAQEEHMPAARTKQQEGEEKFGTRTAGGGGGEENKERNKAERIAKREKEKIALGAVICRNNRSRLGYKTDPETLPCIPSLCRLLPTLVNSRVKCEYVRCRNPPPPSPLWRRLATML